MTSSAPQDRLEKLLAGVRAIGPGIEVRFTPSETSGALEAWSVTVVAGSVILIYVDFDTVDNVLATACVKLASMSSRMMAAVRRTDPPPAPEDLSGGGDEKNEKKP
jgi:hypothetical protein